MLATRFRAATPVPEFPDPAWQELPFVASLADCGPKARPAVELRLVPPVEIVDEEPAAVACEPVREDSESISVLQVAGRAGPKKLAATLSLFLHTGVAALLLAGPTQVMIAGGSTSEPQAVEVVLAPEIVVEPEPEPVPEPRLEPPVTVPVEEEQPEAVLPEEVVPPEPEQEVVRKEPTPEPEVAPEPEPEASPRVETPPPPPPEEIPSEESEPVLAAESRTESEPDQAVVPPEQATPPAKAEAEEPQPDKVKPDAASDPAPFKTEPKIEKPPELDPTPEPEAPQESEPDDAPELAEVPVPTPKPDHQPTEDPEPRPQPKRTHAEKPRPHNAPDKPRRETAQPSRRAEAGAGRQQTRPGNAAVSNYPGKVVTKLKRALRYPPAARRDRLRGEVLIRFTVLASGSIDGVRVARSSGSPVLDKAALDTVRRAAPFPDIPPAAGRSSWAFSVPLSFRP